MKRHGKLFEQIITLDNIRLAYNHAKRGRSGKRAVISFAKNEEANLKQIQKSLISKTYHTSDYKTKTIYEPKERIIYILPFFPDRIVQHAVLNVLEPIWDKLLIDTCYACRKGKGLHKGSQKTMEYVRRNKYCLKCDISKFYPSINHKILKDIIREKIKDKNVLWLLDEIIDSYKGETNVPIGNYTSQWFGNLYLNELDMFVKHTLHFKDYIRYCDDFLFFGNDKKELNKIAETVKKFCSEKLALKFSKCDLFPVSRGVDFLGYRHFPKYVLLRKSTAKRAKKRIGTMLKRLADHMITPAQFRSVVYSYFGWMRWANAFNLKLSLLKRIHYDRF